jgi:hypothetical protein
MATIRTAKGKYEDHVEKHRCRIGKCDERRELWLTYMRQGELWGGYKPAPTVEDVDTTGYL